jgi:Putative quorum-sensing-regulated virulence factor
MQSSEQDRCKKCNGEFFRCFTKIFSNGTKHLEARCADCDTHLHYLPQREPLNDFVHIGDVEAPFGKHKGMKLKDIPKDYLKWMADNTKSRWRELAKQMLDNTKIQN